MDEPPAGGAHALDHEHCEHSPDLNEWCATLYLLTRWPQSPADAHLRHDRSSSPVPISDETLDAQLQELNEMARRTLDR